ncbi:hypothetical protein GCM10009576_021490 [Streptomyces rhizosphaericus]|uniref:Uncharacterized protein n=1 Tax=Streptomyces rhizosphaericus TaxID=114699 RepID=A0ABN1S5V2_9ACTN
MFGGRFRRAEPVVKRADSDRRGLDLWKWRDAVLVGLVFRHACGELEPVLVGVDGDGDGDEVGIMERGRGRGELLVREVPSGRLTGRPGPAPREAVRPSR